MKKTIKKSNITVDGSNGNDQFTIKGSSNTVNAKGGKKDTITIAAGDYHTINGGNGVDIITVKKGNYQHINGDKGNDKIILYNKGWSGEFFHGWGGLWGSDSDRDVTKGGAGNDTIEARKGRHKIYGGTGNDKITIFGTAEDSCEILGEKGNDTIIVKGTKNRHSIDSGTGNDKITVYGGDGHTISAGSSTKGKKDTILVKNSKNSTINGQEGIDKITVTGGAENTLNGDAGNDILLVSGGSKNSVNGGDGKDEIRIKSGSEHQIDGGAASDKIYISGGNNHVVYTGAGNDTIEITGGSGHRINLGNDQNTVALKVKGGVIVNTNSEAIDNITIDKWNSGVGQCTIDASKNTFGKDTLKINGVNSSSFTFKIEHLGLASSKTLILSSNNGAITIESWMDSNGNQTSFDGITFADGKLSLEAINKKAGW